MKIQCPKCKTQYEVNEYEIGRNAECVCGHRFVITEWRNTGFQSTVTFSGKASKNIQSPKVFPKKKYRWWHALFLFCVLTAVGVIFTQKRIEAERVRYEFETQCRNLKSVEDSIREWTDLTSEKMKALNRLCDAHSLLEISYTQRLKIEKEAKFLKGIFSSAKIDSRTGKIINFTDILEKYLNSLEDEKYANRRILMQAQHNKRMAEIDMNAIHYVFRGSVDLLVLGIFCTMLFFIFMPFCRKR